MFALKQPRSGARRSLLETLNRKRRGFKGVGAVVEKWHEKNTNMKDLKDVLIKKKTVKPKAGGVTQEFQNEALRILTGLGVTNRKRYGAYFKVVKAEPRTLINQAYSFAVDHPVPAARDKMFFWKLNDLKRSKNNTKIAIDK